MSITATNYLSRIYDLRNFPTPGEDNDSQSFRDQWENIYGAVDAVNTQVEYLDNNTVKTDQDSDFNGSTIYRANLKGGSTEFVNLSVVIGNRDIDYRTGSYQKFELTSGVHNVTITDWPSNGKSGTIRLSVTASDNVTTAIRFPASYVKITPMQDDAYTLMYSDDPDAPAANIFELWNEDDTVYVQRLSDQFASYNATLTTATLYLAENIITTGTGYITQVESPGGKLSTIALVPNKVTTTFVSRSGRDITVSSAKGIVAGARVNFSNTWSTYFVSSAVTSTNIVTVSDDINYTTTALNGSPVTFINPINTASTQPTVMTLSSVSANNSSTGVYSNGKGSIYAAKHSLEVTFDHYGGTGAAPTTNTFAISTLADSTATSLVNKTLVDTTFIHSIMPYGSVIMWYGLKDNVPAGWAICDGTNGTPDLTNKFVVGGSGDVGPGNQAVPGTSILGATTSTGGYTDIELINHTHTATFSGGTLPDHTHGITEVPHQHIAPTADCGTPVFGQDATVSTDRFCDTDGTGLAGWYTSEASTGITGTDGVDGADLVATGTITVAQTGTTSTGAYKNIPPFVALYYIMKITGINYTGI